MEEILKLKAVSVNHTNIRYIKNPCIRLRLKAMIGKIKIFDYMI